MQSPPKLDPRAAEALAANPDNAEQAAEETLEPRGRGAGRREALSANPDAAAEEAEEELDPAGHAARRAEALAANPDNAADAAAPAEAGPSPGGEDDRSR